MFNPRLRQLSLTGALLLGVGLAACHRTAPVVVTEDIHLGLLRLDETRLVSLEVPREGDPQLKFSCDCVHQVDDGNSSSALRHLIVRPEKPGRLEVGLRVETSRGRVLRQVRFLGWVAAPRPTGLVAAAEIVGGSENVLVDVRSDFRKSQVRIPDAVSLPLRAVARRADWKERKLILIGDGLDESDLQREAAGLRKDGFQSVNVLDGGVPAWLEAGGKVEGTPIAQRDVSMVRAGEVLASSRRGHAWIVVVPSDSDEKSWPGGFTIVRGDRQGRGAEEVLSAATAATTGGSKVLVADPAFPMATLRGVNAFRFDEPIATLQALAPSVAPTLMTISSEARDRSGSLRAAGSGCGGCPGK